jgi:hypothetical protein
MKDNTSIEIDRVTVNFLNEATYLLIEEQDLELTSEDERYLWLNRNCRAIVAKAKSLQENFCRQMMNENLDISTQDF